MRRPGAEQWRRRRARYRVAVLLGACLAVLAPGAAWPAGRDDPRLTPREREDPLEPWSLEPPPRGPVPPPPAALPDTTGRDAIPRAQPPGAPAERPGMSAADSSARVEVVRLRAVLVGRADQAARLVELLRAGATLEAAQRAVGGVAVEERSREMPLGDLEPTLGAEIEPLPVGGWTGVRPWRGRSAFFQVVARETRSVATLPKLGEGLDEREQAKIAALRHPMPVRAPRADSEAANRDYQAASVATQERPEYPASATASGDVTVEVQVGLADDVVDARVLSSTDPIFEPAALAAARRSTYRSARRSGVPEQGTVQLKFQFVAPATSGTTPAP